MSLGPQQFDRTLAVYTDFTHVSVWPNCFLTMNPQPLRLPNQIDTWPPKLGEITDHLWENRRDTESSLESLSWPGTQQGAPRQLHPLDWKPETKYSHWSWGQALGTCNRIKGEKPGPDWEKWNPWLLTLRNRATSSRNEFHKYVFLPIWIKNREKDSLQFASTTSYKRNLGMSWYGKTPYLRPANVRCPRISSSPAAWRQSWGSSQWMCSVHGTNCTINVPLSSRFFWLA